MKSIKIREKLFDFLLIVVGILVALWINNWNEGRKNSNLEKESLNRLMEDLQSDIHLCQRRDSVYSKQIDSARLAQSLFNDIQKKEELFRISRLSNDISLLELTPQTSTYQEMISSGFLFTIKNRELRHQITTHYNWLDRMDYYIRETNLDLAELFNIPELFPFFNFNTGEGELPNLTQLNSDWIHDTKSETYQAVKYYLSSVLILLEDQKRHFEYVVEDNPQLIHKIKTYLKQ